jgi:hypothetical protein
MRRKSKDEPSDDRPRREPRDERQVLEDRKRVCRQVEQMGVRVQDAEYRRHLIRLLQRRRAGDTDLPRIGSVPEAGGSEALVVWGELLLRAEDSRDDRATGLLRRHGLQPHEVECLDGRVVRWVNTELGPKRLHRLARTLRLRGITASVNHVAPLAPIAKGLGGPEPTRVKAGWAPDPRTRGAAAVAVAVIDTGIAHQKRTDGWLTSVKRTRDNKDPLDAIPRGGDTFLDYGAGHGTFAAGAVAQVAPDADLRVVRALDSDGVGSEVEVACAVVEAVRAGADLVNLSLGSRTIDDLPPVAMSVALEIVAEIEEQEGREVMLVAAAGNFGDNRPCWPAAYRRVVSVGALTAEGGPAPWSSRGFWVDCSAVGEGVVSTYVEGTESPELDAQPDTYGQDPWAMWSGTSFAAPQVTGELARLRAESGASLHDCLQRLLKRDDWPRTRIPGYGHALRILPGT